MASLKVAAIVLRQALSPTLIINEQENSLDTAVEWSGPGPGPGSVLMNDPRAGLDTLTHTPHLHTRTHTQTRTGTGSPASRLLKATQGLLKVDQDPAM